MLVAAILFTVGTLSVTPPVMATVGSARVGYLDCYSNNSLVVLHQDAPSAAHSLGWVYLYVGTFELRATSWQWLGWRPWLATQLDYTHPYGSGTWWDSAYQTDEGNIGTQINDGVPGATLYIQFDVLVFPDGFASYWTPNYASC